MGEICGATGFGEGVTVACKWALEAGEAFELQEGSVGGQTQADSGEPGSDAVVWAHPIDVHYSSGSLQVRAFFCVYLRSTRPLHASHPRALH